MHIFVLSTLLGLFVSTKAAKPKSINVALDTVFEFDKPSDVDLIDKVQGILHKVKNIIKENPKIYELKRYKFTNFLEDAINVLQSFTDEDLKEIVQIVDNEIKKHLQSTALEDNLRRFLNGALNRFKIRPIKKIRKDLDTLLRKLTNGINNNDDNNFLDFINTLYKRNSEKKLAKFISNLKIFRRNNFSQKNERFRQAVRRSLSSVIFEHFLNLSENTKQKFVTKIKDFMHGDRSKDESDILNFHSHSKPKPKLVLHYGIEADIFNEDRNESYVPSGTRAFNNYERYESLNQDKSQAIEEKETDSSGEISSKPNNSEIEFKRKIKLGNSKIDQNKNVENGYENVKTKQTKSSTEFEEKSSKEIKRKENSNLSTKYANFKISQYKKIDTKNPHLKVNSRKKITLQPENVENDNTKAVFRDTESIEKRNNEKAKNYETLNDISLSPISNSAEINVNFKNSRMQFSVDDRDDTVEDIFRFNALRQENSQDSTENRQETSRKRFKTVGRSRKLFGGQDNIHKYQHKAKQVGYEQDKFNTKTIVHFKKNVDKGQRNFKYSQKMNNFRRRDHILAKELIADNSYARKKLDQSKIDNRPLYAGDRTIEEDKSQERFDAIIDLKENNVLSAQNKPDADLAKTSNNYSFIDDLSIAKKEPVKRPKTIDVTNHEQDDDDDDDDVNIRENVVDKSMKTIEFTTENEHLYYRRAQPNAIEKLRMNKTKNNKNVKNDINLTKVSHDLYSNAIKRPKITYSILPHENENKKLATPSLVLKNKEEEGFNNNNNKSPIDFNKDIIDILKEVLPNKSTVHKHTPQPFTTERTTAELAQETKEVYNNNLRKEKIRKVKPKRHEININLKNNSEIFERGVKPNEAENSDVRRSFIVVTTRKINKINKLKPLVDITPNNNEILHHNGFFNTTNKNTDSHYKDINTDSRKLLLLNKSQKYTTQTNKIFESKNRETKSNTTPTPKTINSTMINKNTNSRYSQLKLVTKLIENTNITREVKKNESKSNVSKVNASKRNLSTPKTTTVINLDANLDDLAFEATMPDLLFNTNTEADPKSFDIEKYLKIRDSAVEDPKSEIARKMKEDLENIFTQPASIATTSAAYTDIFEALDNAFDL